MSSRYMKRSSTSLITSGMQIKTIVRYHLISIRIVYYQKDRKKSFGKDVEKSEPLCAIGGNVNWCSYYRKQYGDSSKNLK